MSSSCRSDALNSSGYAFFSKNSCIFVRRLLFDTSIKRQSFFLVAVALLTAVPQLMRGIPAYPGRVGTTLVDGRAVGYSLVGDEHRHAFVSDDGYVLRFADGEQAYYKKAE